VQQKAAQDYAMPEFSLILVLQNKTSKIAHGMANIILNLRKSLFLEEYFT